MEQAFTVEGGDFIHAGEVSSKIKTIVINLHFLLNLFMLSAEMVFVTLPFLFVYIILEIAFMGEANIMPTPTGNGLHIFTQGNGSYELSYRVAKMPSLRTINASDVTASTVCRSIPLFSFEASISSNINSSTFLLL